jgi:hypothetical protein
LSAIRWAANLVDHLELAGDLRVPVLRDLSNKGAGTALVMARAHALIRVIAAPFLELAPNADA